MIFDPKMNIQLLLTAVDIQAHILECFGRVNVQQTYVNNTNELLEVIYIFPLSSSDSIISFSINIDEKHDLMGILKDKYTAEHEYIKSINNKQVVCYLEKQHNNGTCTYKIAIGNIEPGSKIKVQFSYITSLNMCNEKYMFVLPANIAPKYQPNIPPEYHIIRSNNQSTYCSYKENNFKLRLYLIWESRTTIQYLESLSHRNDCKIEGSSTIKKVSVEISPLQGDFNLDMMTNHGSYPFVYKYQDKTDTYLMLIHKIAVVDIEDNKQDTEYIFMVDRSGSMESDKIIKTQQALEYFLRSLPNNNKNKNCFFNIVSFGSNYKYMFPQCVEYNDLNLQKALSDIKTFRADMNGTELIDVIDDLLNKNSSKTEKRKYYFLLTDQGQISDVDSVINLIKNYKKSYDRFFTLGIGADADRILIERIAETGCGSYKMAIDSNDIVESIINLLDVSSKNYYHNTKYFFLDNNGFKKESPLDSFVSKSNNIIPNNPFVTIFKIANDKFTQLRGLKLTTTNANGDNFMQDVDFINQNIMNNDIIKKIYGKYLLEKLEQNIDFKNPRKSKDQIINTSLRYGLLCSVIDQQQIGAKNLNSQNQFGTFNKSCESVHDIYCLISSTTNTLIECSEEMQPASYVFKTSLSKQSIFSNFGYTISSAFDAITNIFNNDTARRDEQVVFINTQNKKIDIIKFQNTNGSFNKCNELLQMLKLSSVDLDKLALKYSTSIDLALHIYLVKYFRARNQPSEKLILKKLTLFVIQRLQYAEKLEQYLEK